MASNSSLPACIRHLKNDRHQRSQGRGAIPHLWAASITHLNFTFLLNMSLSYLTFAGIDL